jgi:hypothetical protein
MKIVGMKIEKYVGTVVDGHNCDFEYRDAELEKHILFGVLSDAKKVKITLSETFGECYSGWTTASWGNVDVEYVTHFGGYTFRPKKEILIDDLLPGQIPDDISNDVFSYSKDGGDEYYPGGSYHVNMDLFIETVRHKEKRPVWIFKGSSNAGKSFLASNLSGLSVYETDASDVLPDVITEDVIVLGNKYLFNVEEIREKLFGECEICVVNFEISK